MSPQDKLPNIGIIDYLIRDITKEIIICIMMT